MTEKMKLIYIAHPLAGDGSALWGDRGKNVERYLKFCVLAQRQGHAVASWVHHELIWQRDLDGVRVHPASYWLDRDLVILERCDEVWICGPLAVSKGLQIEMDAAVKASIPVVHLPEWDDRWFEPLEAFGGKVTSWW